MADRPTATARFRVVAVVCPGSTVGPVDLDHPLGGIPIDHPLGGIPIAERSVGALAGSGVVDEIVLALPRATDLLDRGWPLPVSARRTSPQGPGEQCVIHGDERRHCPCGDLSLVVLVHDIARPLVPASLLTALVASALAGCAVTVPVLPLTDTCKSLDHRGRVLATPDRAGLRVVQTPQAFRPDLLAGTLAAVLAQPAGRSWAAAGVPAHTVAGSPRAAAVHTAWDLTVATALLEDEHP